MLKGKGKRGKEATVILWVTRRCYINSWATMSATNDVKGQEPRRFSMSSNRTTSGLKMLEEYLTRHWPILPRSYMQLRIGLCLDPRKIEQPCLHVTRMVCINPPPSHVYRLIYHYSSLILVLLPFITGCRSYPFRPTTSSQRWRCIMSVGSHRRQTDAHWAGQSVLRSITA